LSAHRFWLQSPVELSAIVTFPSTSKPAKRNVMLNVHDDDWVAYDLENCVKSDKVSIAISERTKSTEILEVFPMRQQVVDDEGERRTRINAPLAD